MKDYSELTSKIYMQLSPELSQEFHNMLTNMAKEISRLYEIDNAKPSEALEHIEILAGELGTSKDVKFAETRFPKMLITIQQSLLKAQEQEKVLIIIKEKNVDIYNLKTCISLEHYNSEIRLKNQNNTYSYEIWYELTEEEFELLKRYFENE